uniref:peptidylprolyl isomerase n=1 Tax=Leptocylindrus danicus TaxID=163516 RepID=A0A7S2P2I6_9STRA
MMKRLAAFTFTALVATVAGKQGDGTDLPPDSMLRIGVKKRVPDSECPRKSSTGDKLEVHYVGKLYKNNEQFDSSRDRGEPFSFNVGVGRVIQGWDRGLLNMCEGELRKIVVPSDLGYGDVGSGSKIPGGATLVFEVELLKIRDGNEFDEEDMWGDMYGEDMYGDMFGGGMMDMMGGYGGFPDDENVDDMYDMDDPSEEDFAEF